MATLGTDGGEYLQRLAALGTATAMSRWTALYTAQAKIMTDRDNNQITVFHLGAMMQAHITRIESHPDIIGASSRQMGAMPCWKHAAVRGGWHSFVFDPGQGLPMFNGAGS